MGTSKLRESNLEYLRILSMILLLQDTQCCMGGGDASDSKWDFALVMT